MARPEKKQSQATADSDRGSWLEVVTATINNHLQAFRALPWVMGGVGALLIVRYSRMFTRYRRAADIPSHLITQGATLRGVAVGAGPDGCLDVWHTPPGRRWLNWTHIPPKPYAADQVLKVRLAAVAIQQHEAVDLWISSNLIGCPVWLQLFHYSATDDSIHCIVKYRKKYSLRALSCANAKLLSLGLVTLEEPSYGCHGSKGSLGNEKRIAFLSEGVKAEGGAQRRGEGVWRDSVHEAKWRKMRRLLKHRN